MDDDQQFCLRWNNHQSTLISVFDTLLENETLVDCTLAAEGKYLKAHKVVLSACSPYFATLLQEQYDKHPIFILKDVKYQELRAMMDYMYRGEVNISQDQLAALLKAAESLQIKGLSDNRSGGSASQPKPDHHRASMPGKLSGGYTLEQTKRARITGAGGPAIDASEMGSREGSSSPSRRRRKVRRRSIENALTDVHDNSNSSQQPTQSNASGLGAITAAASALAAAAAVAPTTAAALASTVVPLSATQQQPPQQTSSSAVSTAVPGTTLSSSKKTDNVKGSTQHQQQQDAMNTENVQGPAASATPAMDTDATDASTADKSNHKQQKSSATGASKDTSSVTGSDLVIEPKAEYDDEANDENVEDLTLDEEDMGMDDLDHNAGTSQGGEGSSQGYAPWQHDRSQDELLLATQEAQQRDPQDLRTLYNIASAAAAVIAAASSQQKNSSGLNISSNLGNNSSSCSSNNSTNNNILNNTITPTNSSNKSNLIDNINTSNNSLSNLISISNNPSHNCSNTKNQNVAATSLSLQSSTAVGASCLNTPRSSHSRNSLDCPTAELYDQELSIHKIYKCCNTAGNQSQQHHSQRCHQVSGLSSASSSPLNQVNLNVPIPSSSSVICSSNCGTLGAAEAFGSSTSSSGRLMGVNPNISGGGSGGSVGGLGVVSLETLSGTTGGVSITSSSRHHHHQQQHPHSHGTLKKSCSSSTNTSSHCCPSENCNDCQISVAAAAAASYQLANLLGSTMLLPHVSNTKNASSSNKLVTNSSSGGVNASAVVGSLKSLGGSHVPSGGTSSPSMGTGGSATSSSTLNTVPKKVNATVFQCEFCTFSCSWKYDLKLHMRQKHGIHNKKM
ncbi:longitudinals lacking isoform X4 [Haematobia irritans]|uniref:longitudinals lacking isoform X4 n=1 Tax=Haematobia irritans TaxID=7368 RepID=UPI003F4FB332